MAKILGVDLGDGIINPNDAIIDLKDYLGDLKFRVGKKLTLAFLPQVKDIKLDVVTEGSNPTSTLSFTLKEKDGSKKEITIGPKGKASVALFNSSNVKIGVRSLNADELKDLIAARLALKTNAPNKTTVDGELSYDHSTIKTAKTMIDSTLGAIALLRS